MKLKDLFRKKEEKKRPPILGMEHTELSELCLVFETLNKLKQSGLLYFDFANRNVTIAQVLAEFYIYDDQDWQRFLRQLHLWAAYQYSISEYTRLMNKHRADCEAEAYRKKNEGVAVSKRQPLTDEERAAARQRATTRFDQQRAAHPALPMPDIQFIILGIDDGQPLSVSRLLKGKYETALVPD